MPQNPFEKLESAETYQKFRPSYHHIPCQEIAEVAGEMGPALDVACGTGQSTDALSKFIEEVSGCDISEAMLDVARKNYDLNFIKADASKLPFQDSSMALVTVFMGFHWLDQKKFLNEAFRVLDHGYLAIDNFWFTSEMTDSPEFKSFHEKFYRDNFPFVSREKAHLPDDEMDGFQRLLDFNYEHTVEMDADYFIGFLLSHSNLILSTKFDQTKLPAILNEAYAHFFKGFPKKMKFAGLTKLYKKKPE